MRDLSQIAGNLALAPDGVWRARSHSRVDYPDDGNATCFEVEDHSYWFRHRNACLVELVRRFPPAGEIFDIGGGNGFVAQGLANAGFPTVLVEPGANGIRNARSRGLAPLVESTLQDAGFFPGSVPAAGLFDVVEHLADDIEALAMIHELLAPGGRIYLTVPAYEWLWSDEDVLGGHHRRYTKARLMTRLTRAGFDVEYAGYLFAVMPLPVLLMRAIPHRLGFRRGPSREQLASELKDQQGLAMRIISAALAGERRWLARGGALPIGSSCVAVARRR